MPVISNTTPLILYAKIGRLHLLQEEFGEVRIPTAVYDELVSEGASLPGATEVAVVPWIRQHPLAANETARALQAELDRGEAEAIALAIEEGGQTPILLDDRKGRRVARRLGLRIFGSAGVLVLAKQRGTIADVRPLLNELRSAGLFLAESVYREILTLAGE